MLKSSKDRIKGRVVDNVVTLDIIDKDIHYWSPHLNMRVEVDEQRPDHSTIYGLIGPRPIVWTLFMFIYFFIGTIGFIIFSLGVSRWMLGEYSGYLWAAPISILFMLTAYKAGKYGEKLGEDQIEVLKQFVRDAIS